MLDIDQGRTEGWDQAVLNSGTMISGVGDRIHPLSQDQHHRHLRDNPQAQSVHTTGLIMPVYCKSKYNRHANIYPP